MIVRLSYLIVLGPSFACSLATYHVRSLSGQNFYHISQRRRVRFLIRYDKAFSISLASLFLPLLSLQTIRLFFRRLALLCRY